MCNGSKQQVANAVTLYYAFRNKQIQLPHFKTESKIIWIPTENELDQLISGCRHQLPTFLQTLKETAGRCGEIYQAEWKDLDTVNKTFLINHPEKQQSPSSLNK